jgi:hypothetical protein
MPRPGCEGFSSFVPKGKKPEQSGARSSPVVHKAKRLPKEKQRRFCIMAGAQQKEHG